MAFVLDADDGKDSTNDDGNETPGMLHTALLLLIFLLYFKLFYYDHFVYEAHADWQLF